jgi:hypothetical protein
MMKPKLVTKSTTVDGTALLDVLSGRLTELEDRRRVVIEEIIEVERTVPRDDGGTVSIVEHGLAMLERGEFSPSREKPLTAIARLRAERDTIDAALKIGRSREHQAFLQRAGDIYAEHFDEIRTLEKRRVPLAVELQAVNRSREALRERLDRAGCPGRSLPTDSASLLGLGDVHDMTAWALNRVVADGIVSRDEIEKAKSHG